MRIGIDARLVYYSQAGISQYTLRLIQGLAESDRENEFIILQSRKDKHTIVDKPNFKRVSLWTPSHHRFEPYTLRMEISRLDLDVLRQGYGYRARLGLVGQDSHRLGERG